MRYQHRQSGFIIIALIAFAIFVLIDILTVSVMFGHGKVATWLNPLIITITVLTVLIGILFSTLTIKVDENNLTWHFSFGFWRKKIALADISSVKPVRNRWWNGWGIRRISGGWLYNVSGLDAVEVRFGDGRLLRLGSDEPESLIEAIKSGYSSK